MCFCRFEIFTKNAFSGFRIPELANLMQTSAIGYFIERLIELLLTSRIISSSIAVLILVQHE